MNYWEKVGVAARQYRWAVLATPAAIAVIVGGSVIGFGTRTVEGTATANRGQVVAVQEERAAATAFAAQQAQEALLASIEASTRAGMQAFFDDPANGLDDEGIVVSKVALVWVEGSRYDGLATMSAGGRASREVSVHVTDDGRTAMWETDEGGLLPLFR